MSLGHRASCGVHHNDATLEFLNIHHGYWLFDYWKLRVYLVAVECVYRRQPGVMTLHWPIALTSFQDRRGPCRRRMSRLSMGADGEWWQVLRLLRSTCVNLVRVVVCYTWLDTHSSTEVTIIPTTGTHYVAESTVRAIYTYVASWWTWVELLSL